MKGRKRCKVSEPLFECSSQWPCHFSSSRLLTAHPPASSRMAENSCATSGWLAVLAKNQLLIMSLYFLRSHDLGSGLRGLEFRHRRMRNLRPNRDYYVIQVQSRLFSSRPACCPNFAACSAEVDIGLSGSDSLGCVHAEFQSLIIAQACLSESKA